MLLLELPEFRVAVKGLLEERIPLLLPILREVPVRFAGMTDCRQLLSVPQVTANQGISEVKARPFAQQAAHHARRHKSMSGLMRGFLPLAVSVQNKSRLRTECCTPEALKQGV